MRKIIMQKEELFLTTTSYEDIEYLSKLFEDYELMRYTFAKTFSKEEAQEYIKSCFNFSGNLGFSPLFFKENIIGFGGVFKFDENSYELGYILDKKYWKKGLATKAASMQRDYITNTLCSQAVATAHPDNLASQRVLQKCGFEFQKDIFMPERGQRKLFVYDERKLFFK